jgi:hypothetical protein
MRDEGHQYTGDRPKNYGGTFVIPVSGRVVEALGPD